MRGIKNRAWTAAVVAVCVMVNRNPKNVNAKMMGTPFYSLDIFPAEAFDENVCPMCKNKQPINTKIGHGKKYLESLAKQS